MAKLETVKGEKPFGFVNKHSKKVLIGLIFVSVVALTAAGGYFFYEKAVNKDVFAIVGNEKITQQDLKNAVYGVEFSQNSNITDYTTEVQQQLKDGLILDSIVRQEALKMGIAVSDEEIKTDIDASKDEASGWIYDNFDDNQKALIWNGTKSKLLKDKVISASISQKEGAFLVFNFHKYIKDPAYNIPDNGNQALLNQHKTYALKLANEIVQNYRSGQITLEEAKAKLLADTTIGEEALMPRTPIMWNDFTASEYMNNQELFAKDVYKQAVSKLGSSGVTDPIADVGKFNGEESEYRYIVLFVTNSAGGSYQTYESWLNAKLKEYTKSKITFESVLRSVSPKANAAPAQCTSACNSDNADIYVLTKYFSAVNTYISLGGVNVTFKAGATGDAAAGPDSAGTTCGGRVNNVTSDTVSSGITNYGVGTTSICRSNYSYYCSTASVAWITLNGNGKIRTGDVGSGNWSWELRHSDGEGTSTYGTDFQNDGRMTNGRSSAPTDSDVRGTYYAYSGNNYDDGDYRVTLFNQNTASSPQYRIRISLSSTQNVERVRYNGATAYNYFVWRPNFLTLTFNGNGNTGGTAPESVAGIVGGESITLPGEGALIKAGNTFGGWCTTTVSTCTTVANPYTMPEVDTTLYARWVPITIANPAATCSITASPASITSGETSTLTWNTQNATSATMDQSVGSVAVGSGSVVVSPSVNTNYTLSVSGAGGNGSCSVQVFVDVPTSNPTLILDSPAHNTLYPVAAGGTQSVTLSATLSDPLSSATRTSHITLMYHKSGVDQWTTCPKVTSSVNAASFTASCVAGSLPIGDYWWAARGSVTDTSKLIGQQEISISDPAQRLFRIMDSATTDGGGSASTLFCSITPITGSKPLTVSIGLESAPVGPYVITVDGHEVNRPNALPYYHTFPTAGSYTVSVDKDPSVDGLPCSGTVNVTGSTSGNGGEVTP